MKEPLSNKQFSHETQRHREEKRCDRFLLVVLMRLSVAGWVEHNGEAWGDIRQRCHS